jgi:hypothetical protein
MICKEARLPQTYDNYVFDLYTAKGADADYVVSHFTHWK